MQANLHTIKINRYDIGTRRILYTYLFLLILQNVHEDIDRRPIRKPVVYRARPSPIVRGTGASTVSRLFYFAIDSLRVAGCGHNGNVCRSVATCSLLQSCKPFTGIYHSESERERPHLRSCFSELLETRRARSPRSPHCSRTADSPRFNFTK